ncbi:MAG: hypothetical protein IKN72_12320 [Clostridia bacterium]|nr:hypothetical protein [Clostridia bacterium]MBR3554152.1 hypothetical protein [Clostridia bacterium]
MSQIATLIDGIFNFAEALSTIGGGGVKQNRLLQLFHRRLGQFFGLIGKLTGE